MKESKVAKVEQARQALIDHDIYFLEYTNGHFHIDSINFWATSGTWIDNIGTRGKGLNSLLDYLEGVRT